MPNPIEQLSAAAQAALQPVARQAEQQMAAKVDAEVARIIDAAYQTCKTLLTKHKDDTEKLTQALLEHETLDAKQVDDLLAGRTVVAAPKEKVKGKKAQKAAPKVGGGDAVEEA